MAVSLDAPGRDPLQIGPVVFNSVECPSKLPIGGFEQKLVVLEKVGGGRETQSMGGQPKPVMWSGTFYQPTLESRVSTLQRMSNDGKEYPLSFGSERYFCKVKEFLPGYSNTNLCEYEITVEITRAANGKLIGSAPTTVDDQVSAISGNIAIQNTSLLGFDPVGAQAFQPQLASVRDALANAGPIAQVLGAPAVSILGTIDIALRAVTDYSDALDEGTGQYVASQQLIALLNLLTANITRGQSQATVRVQGANYFELASQFYGDPSLAFDLMQANGASSPYTSSTQPSDIVLPPLQTSAA